MNQAITPTRQDTVEAITAGHPLAKACDQCHRCKVACDSEKPSCQRCTRNGSACTYSLGRTSAKTRVRRSRSHIEERVAHSQPSDNSITPVIISETGKRMRDESSEDSLYHKRHHPTTNLSISSDNGVVYMDEAYSAGTETSNTSLTTTCDTDNTTHGTDALACLIRDEVSSTQDIPNSLAYAKTLVVSSEPWEFDDYPFVLGSTTGIVETDSNIFCATHNLSTPTRPDQASMQLRLAECECISNLLGMVPVMEECKSISSLKDAIQIVRKAQGTIRNVLDCKVTHQSQEMILTCTLLLRQLVSYCMSNCNSRGNKSSNISLSVRVCGIDISIGESDVTRRILDAVLATQLNDALSLSSRLCQVVEGGCHEKRDKVALKELVGLVREDLKVAALQATEGI